MNKLSNVLWCFTLVIVSTPFAIILLLFLALYFFLFFHVVSNYLDIIYPALIFSVAAFCYFFTRIKLKNISLGAKMSFLTFGFCATFYLSSYLATYLYIQKTAIDNYGQRPLCINFLGALSLSLGPSPRSPHSVIFVNGIKHNWSFKERDFIAHSHYKSDQAIVYWQNQIKHGIYQC